jgi:hypothetical protein
MAYFSLPKTLSMELITGYVAELVNAAGYST